MTEVQLLRGSVESLQRQRDEWVAKHKECTRLLGESMQDTTNVSIERDALKTSNDIYITLANTAYELTDQRTAERDALTAANRDLQDWFDALMTDHDALKAELEIARMVPYVAAMSEIAKERDTLKDAARLALDALEYTAQTRRIARTQIAIAALKAVL